MANIVIKIGDTEYQVDSWELTVSGGEAFEDSITTQVEYAQSRYSPSLGGPVTFVANHLRDWFDAEILSVHEVEMRDDVDY
jgi:hypothetical protein